MVMVFILQVPGATHGLLGLVEHALAHQEEAALTGPIAVHCRLDSYLLLFLVVVVVKLLLLVLVVVGLYGAQHEGATFTGCSACDSSYCVC